MTETALLDVQFPDLGAAVAQAGPEVGAAVAEANAHRDQFVQAAESTIEKTIIFGAPAGQEVTTRRQRGPGGRHRGWTGARSAVRPVRRQESCGNPGGPAEGSKGEIIFLDFPTASCSLTYVPPGVTSVTGRRRGCCGGTLFFTQIFLALPFLLR
jgi:hypothetical protein